MKIIIGLGNPGEKYTLTRHNVGFEIIDAIWKKWDFPKFEFSKKFEAEFSKGKFEGNDVMLLKPQTFMNLSGRPILSAMDFYHLSTDNIIVIHDDLDIQLGKYKVATDSSSAGHNGVRDIIEKLGTKNFRRIRIGIKPEEKSINDAADFVLHPFNEEELKKIAKIRCLAIEEIEKSAK